ncbi:RNA polymerase sigma factor [Cereibacter sphaeroides KD131]|nr:RNA polymerase sigma factor [Cereibacter sphaeroides KD131]
MRKHLRRFLRLRLPERPDLVHDSALCSRCAGATFSGRPSCLAGP